MKNILVVGLTGGIGSGKSTIAKKWSDMFGVGVYESDKEAKRLVNEDKKVKEEIISHFGKESFKEGKYNTKYISGIVFEDKKKLRKLNEIIHPKVLEDFKKWSKSQSGKYVILESAILFDSKFNEKCDFIVYIFAQEDVRIERVVVRDVVSREEVEKRIKNQRNGDIFEKLSNFVIKNEEKSNISEKICEIHFEILKKMI